MLKNAIVSAIALVVIGTGSVEALHAQALQPPLACCHTLFTKDVCCGNACTSGFFTCSAS